MIEQLMVKDYILFDYVLLDFNKGMTVITGETGAGKSLLIDAIGYLCGQRITSNIVRKPAKKAILQMVLSCSDSRIISYLEENDFEVEDEIIIQRTVTDQQKSTIRINQQITTLSFVRSLMAKMIDIHSQMDTYQLMNEKVQMNVLDQYAHTFDLREEVSDLFDQYKKASDELEHLQNKTFSDDELDYVTFQYNKIEEANVQEGEFEQLQEDIKKLTDIEKNLENYSTCSYTISKDNGLLDQLYELSHSLQKSSQFEKEADTVENMYYSLQDIDDSLKEVIESGQQDQMNLDSLQSREYEIRQLFKKYGGSYDSLMEQKQKLNDQIDAIIHKEDVLKKKTMEVESLYNQYMKKALPLSKARQNAFKILKKEVESHFQDLMLDKARFQIAREEIKPSKTGIDSIEFQVSMNPGQPYSPLKESASGGELSRLMLALKVVFQSEEGIDTLLFDEIDTGVSGKVAFAMGSKMKSLSNNHQVLCITHLASVAAWADTHFCVSKSSTKNSTETKVEELDIEKQYEELSMMASGQVNQASLDAAKELKERAHLG